MQKLSSFRGKTKNRPKKSLTWFFHAALQLIQYVSLQLKITNEIGALVTDGGMKRRINAIFTVPFVDVLRLLCNI